MTEVPPTWWPRAIRASDQSELSNEIAADRSLNPTQSGWIGGIYLAGYALAVPFLANASDGMDARWLYVGVRLGAAASFAFALLAGGFARGYGDSLLDLLQQTRLTGGVRVHSRHWPGLAGCQAAATPALERRDPFGCPKRSSDGGRALDPSCRGGVGRACEKGGKIGISARDGATVANSSSAPAIWTRALDHDQSSAWLTSPAAAGLRAM
jgi:hypothetical protein